MVWYIHGCFRGNGAFCFFIIHSPCCAGAAGGQALEHAHERLFVAFRMQRKRALAGAIARLEVALQEDAALAELEALESAGEEVSPPASVSLHPCTSLFAGMTWPCHWRSCHLVRVSCNCRLHTALRPS